MHADEAIEKLGIARHRMTKLRRAMIELLFKVPAPVSALDVESQLRENGLTANRTSIYRELDFLVAQQLISEVDFLDKTKRYELRGNGPHHHLVCTACGRVQCVDLCVDLQKAQKEIRKSWKFEVQKHVLEFYGLCAGCRVRPG